MRTLGIPLKIQFIRVMQEDKLIDTLLCRNIKGEKNLQFHPAGLPSQDFLHYFGRIVLQILYLECSTGYLFLVSTGQFHNVCLLIRPYTQSSLSIFYQPNLSNELAKHEMHKINPTNVIRYLLLGPSSGSKQNITLNSHCTVRRIRVTYLEIILISCAAHAQCVVVNFS